MYYNGDDTHSCMYIFNPLSNPKLEKSLPLVNITRVDSNHYQQIRFEYKKQIFSYNPNIFSRLSRTFTLYSEGQGRDDILNVTYQFENYDHKEFFIRLKRGNMKNGKIYCDNSAFNI